MSFIYQEQPANSSFAEAIWKTEDTADGMYLAAADGSWDLIFTTSPEGETTVLASGPSSRASPVPYRQGNRNFGIRFRPGAFMPHLPAAQMRDVTTALPQRSKHSFWFQGEEWQLPTFENAGEYLAKLARRQLVAHDNIVTAVLGGLRPPVSDRTVQRRFLHATGLTPTYISNINRANQAVALLQRGTTISDVVTELGYADQAHMTRRVKHVSGRTPGEIIKKVEECRLRSIPNYGVCAQMKVQNIKGETNYGGKTVQNSN
ncbi:MAG: helix-turn-helix domain-containing protein [Candidatus Saccharimonadales bacterium]